MQLPDLPVRAVLDELNAALARHGTTVLVAPPGTGKTTLVPLALPGRVVVAEPRRLAARAAAARMAELINEPVGQTVGYAVRGDRRTSKKTRIEVVTSGLLLRRLQHDPELTGTDVVLLDECHERHLDADLLLALLLDAREGLRPDLKVLATSATVASQRLAQILGADTPVIEAHARTFPITTTYVPAARSERPEQHVARTVHKALSEADGDILVFLPGVPEIRRVTQQLPGLNVLPLHGRLATKAQDDALRRTTQRRIVLATAVAESSLTVPGVRTVVDAGLARSPRADHRRGLSGLVTTRVSQAVADQRAGRAGREAPGHVYRCWPEHEQATLPRYPEPEIRTAELTRLALELACWGTPDGSNLAWWDAPPPGALAAGQTTLRNLGALDDHGVTDRGRRIAELGLHPRLGRALLDGAQELGARPTAEVVALLDDDSVTTSNDVETAIRALRRDRPHSWLREVERLTKLVEGRGAKDDPALIVALAHPERLAKRRQPGSRSYLMAGGTAVETDGPTDSEWLAVAVADREPGRAHGRVRLAARADQELAERAAPALLSEQDEVTWTNGDVVARRVRRLGAIVLTERPIKTPDPEGLRKALTDGLHREGTSLLGWSQDATRQRQRMAFLHTHLGDPWPDVSDDAIIRNVDLSTARKRSDLARISAQHVLQTMLPWPTAARFDELAPDRIEVPSGSKLKVDYTADGPVLPVKVQETFGWTDTPTIADGRVPVVLHLLSPAGRPVAVTGDLASFWRNGYLQVRSELRGRYPKHPWPEDPVTAVPTRRTKPR
ncbi:ATP-dependent helicase HrpB [Kutzneria chonburiensis]|uniref:ATP-dependent helicase HrpB n=1 Tax=Kutzneria chonburiensis TaxID=1483604 RepID=A0ABV6N6W1_9PSEU|nr:ATP-dependent helicase HrpB [Kutzneria chonburiensis]